LNGSKQLTPHPDILSSTCCVVQFRDQQARLQATMAWPKIGQDLVALHVATSRRPLLAVLCCNEGDTDLWGANARAVSAGLGMTSIDYQQDDTWDMEIWSLLQSHGGDWADAFCVATITDGKNAGCRAIGVGSNVKKRRKAVRLAMAVTLRIFEGDDVVEELQHVVVQAKQALAAVALAAVESNQLVAAPREEEAIAEASCPAMLVTKPAISAGRDVTVDPSAPRECLEDPFTELRVWIEAQNGEPAVLWPYCTHCNCWTEKSHHFGKYHQKALAYSNAIPTSQPSHGPAAVDKHDASAQPSRSEEKPPPMDIEFELVPPDWMWGQGSWGQDFMQHGMPWLQLTQPNAPLIQEVLPLQPPTGPPAPEEPQPLGGTKPHRLWTHAINNVPWDVPWQDGTSAPPPWSSCVTVSSGKMAPLLSGSTTPQQKEPEDAAELSAALENVVILPKCRFTDHIATKEPKTTTLLPGCIEV